MTGTAASGRARATRRGEWLEETRLVVGDVEFEVVVDPDRYMAEESTSSRFVVAKRPDMVELLTDVVHELQPRHIVELGIFKGGSAALLASLAQPEMLTAIELSPEPVRALETFLTEHDLRESVACHYATDQADRDALEAILRADHGGAPLDLVVDDASHLLAPTRSSFEVLFPRLRPGGMFLIEDWAWAHYPEPAWQRGGGVFHDRPALSNLIVELMMIVGSRSDLIADVTIVRDIALIRRGPLETDGPVRLEEHYVNRGLPFRPIL